MLYLKLFNGLSVVMWILLSIFDPEVITTSLLP